MGGRLFLLGLFLLPAQSLLWAADVPVVIKFAALAVVLLTTVRPVDGLLVVAALAPLGIMFSRILQSPARGSEALVLAFLVGWLLSTLRSSDRHTTRLGTLSVPLALFGVMVVSSCVERLVILQFQRDYPWPFLQTLSVYAARDYLLGPGGFGFVQTTLRLLEGLALFGCVVSLGRTDPTVVRRVTRALVGGAVGTALLSVIYVAMEALETENWLTGLSVALEDRWTAFVGDVNAAGSYFVLTAGIALGAALAGTRWSVVWLTASVCIFIALFLTGSIAAILSALILIGAAVAWSLAAYIRAMTRGQIAATASLAAVTLTALTIAYSDVALSPRVTEPLNIRFLFLETSFDMIASRPLFGVGVGAYYQWSALFSPPELLEIYDRENAHNYFLQIAGELGLVGLAGFVWLLSSALWTAWPAAREVRRHPLGFGLLAGVTAFLITCLSGHPLLIPEVIYPFWIALGLAVCASPARTTRDPTPRQRVVVAAIVAFLVFSIPTRVTREKREIDATRIAHGFHAWEEDPGGTPFRWTRRRARIHVTGDTRLVEIPLRGRIEDAEHPLAVDILVDGSPVIEMQLFDTSWHHVRVDMPPVEDLRFRRIEVLVGRTFVPEDSIPGSTDSRELGVQVGEVGSSSLAIR